MKAYGIEGPAVGVAESKLLEVHSRRSASPDA